MPRDAFYNNMIFDGIFVLAMNMLAYIARFQPVISEDNTSLISDNVVTFKSIISIAGSFFDLETFWAVLSIVVTIEATIFTFHFIRWLVTIVSAGFIKAK